MRLRGGEMKMVRVRGIEGKRTFMERLLPMTLFLFKMEFLTKKMGGGAKNGKGEKKVTLWRRSGWRVREMPGGAGTNTYIEIEYSQIFYFFIIWV